jgi:hypothetical protein
MRLSPLVLLLVALLVIVQTYWPRAEKAARRARQAEQRRAERH